MLAPLSPLPEDNAVAEDTASGAHQPSVRRDGGKGAQVAAQRRGLRGYSKGEGRTKVKKEGDKHPMQQEG